MADRVTWDEDRCATVGCEGFVKPAPRGMESRPFCESCKPTKTKVRAWGLCRVQDCKNEGQGYMCSEHARLKALRTVAETLKTRGVAVGLEHPAPVRLLLDRRGAKLLADLARDSDAEGGYALEISITPTGIEILAPAHPGFHCTIAAERLDLRPMEGSEEEVQHVEAA